MRRLVILLAATVVAMMIAVLILRSSLIHDDLRAAVESRLSATLGQPVSIGSLGLSLLGGVVVTGSDIRVGEADVEAPSVAVQRIRIRPRLFSLLGGDPGIDDIELSGFVLSVLRDEDGWHVPAAVPAASTGEGGGMAIEQVRLTDGTLRIFDATGGAGMQSRGSIDGIATSIAVEGGELRLPSISARVGESALSGEAAIGPKAAHLRVTSDALRHDDLPRLLELLGAERPSFLRLDEPAALTADVALNREQSRLSGTGTLRAPALALDEITLQQFDARFAIDGTRLTFDPATFALYGGKHEGSLRFDLSREPAAWAMKSRVSGIDVSAFLSALAGAAGRLDGRAAITADLEGHVGASLVQSLDGRARFDVDDGVIREFPLLAYINSALRLAEHEGRDTQFERLTATLAIASGGATTDDLVLQAAHVRVAAGGRIGADRSLSLRGLAVLSPERSAAAIRSVRELSALRNANGELEIPLTISGSLDNPDFGLDLQATLKKGLADELRRRLLRIIR